MRRDGRGCGEMGGDEMGWDGICRDFPGYKRNLVHFWEHWSYFGAIFMALVFRNVAFPIVKWTDTFRNDRYENYFQYH